MNIGWIADRNRILEGVSIGVVLIGLMGACSESTGTDTTGDGDTASSPDGNTETDTEIGTGSGTAIDDVDCNNLPTLPFVAKLVAEIPSSEDFVFDKDGYLVQFTWEGVVEETAYDGDSVILTKIDNLGAQGTRFLSNGDLIVTDAAKNQLVRIHPNGSYEPVAMGLSDPNGIAVHLNGTVYVTSATGRIYRFDPVANTYDVVIEKLNCSFDGITFSPDYKTLYFNEERGTIHKAAVNPDGTLQPDEILAVLEQRTDFLDGMTADSCGNVYSVDMGGVIWRITPTGEIALAVEIADESGDPMHAITPAVNFGSGYGGWKATHLFIMSFDGGLFEAAMGVPGKPEPHL